ncbi:MAG: PAS domain S-box protein [Cyclobacteriaceae bacterium]
MSIQLLYVEDNPSDVALFTSILDTSKLLVDISVNDDLSEIKKRLKNVPDLIVSDFNLRGFTGMDILELAKDLCPEVPFIFFTSTLGEERAVELIRQGATDFVLKDNIVKIPLAIERAYNESRARQEKRQIENQLLQKSTLLDTLFNSLTDLVMQTNKSGEITEVNMAFCRFFKTTQQNVIGKKESSFITSPESKIADDKARLNKEPSQFEIDQIDDSGRRRILEVVKSPLLEGNSVQGIVSMMRDTTSRRLLEESKAKGNYLLQQAESQTWSGSFEFDEENDILSMSPNFVKLLNLRTEKSFISYKKFTSCIHPEDLPLFSEKFDKAISDKVDFELEHRYIPLGLTHGHKYCKTVLRPYAGQSGIIFYGTIQDTTERRETSIALLNVQEEERERISKELHDNVGQKLSASSMFIDSGDNIAKAKGLLDDAIADIRSLSRLLTASVLQGNTLASAFEFLLDNTPKSEIVSLKMDIDEDRLPEFIANQLYRIVQEALNNALKYSNAEEIILELSQGEHMFSLNVSDNGVGFDPHKTKFGNGVRNMKERVRNCNGEFNITSEPEQGTKIEIKIPIQNE